MQPARPREQYRNGDVRQRVRGCDAKQLASQHPRRRETHARADNEADNDQSAAGDQHQPKDVPPRGAERHPNSEFLSTAEHVE